MRGVQATMQILTESECRLLVNFRREGLQRSIAASLSVRIAAILGQVAPGVSLHIALLDPGAIEIEAAQHELAFGLPLFGSLA